MILSDLLTGVTTEKYDQSILTKEISDVHINSRKVGQGSLFICMPGLTVDGHDYALSAQEKGAVVIICEREIEGVSVPCIRVKDARIAFSQIASNFYGNPSKNLKIIGVTGTNGKTTVTHLIKEILDHAGKKTGLIGTTHNMIGEKIMRASMTTPDPMDFHQLLKEMVEEKCEYVIMEVSSHALALNKLFGCNFEIGSFTNLTQDHLDFHKTMEEYFAAKAKLFAMSKKGAVNADDSYGIQLLNQGRCDCLSFGMGENCDVRAVDVSFEATGIRFTCVTGKESSKIKLRIPGSFSVYNALTAISVCLQLGMSLNEIADGLAIAHGVKGRVEVVPTDRDFTILIDYAHTPDALENVLATIRRFATGRIVVLFGCGGDRDKTKRPIMGRIAMDGADSCIITSDNPRSEPPMEIIKDILSGIKGGEEKYIVIENRFEAIKYAIAHAQKDDIILLAGKGHETYQILMDKTIDFDERKVIKMCLNTN